MIRGSVWWVDLDPTTGSEIQKTRPAVIVSNDIANKALDRVVIVPLTSNIKFLYPGNAFVSVNGQKSRAVADQIRAVDKARLSNKLCDLSEGDMLAIDEAIKTHLALA